MVFQLVFLSGKEFFKRKCQAFVSKHGIKYREFPPNLHHGGITHTNKMFAISMFALISFFGAK